MKIDFVAKKAAIYGKLNDAGTEAGERRVSVADYFEKVACDQIWVYTFNSYMI